MQASQSIGKYSLLLLSLVLMHSGSSLAQSAPTASPKANSPALAPGTTIDASNAGSYVQYLPVAAQAAISHGLKLQIVPTKRLDWSTGFTEATEKYSSQVGLDAEDSITNYVAGAPFPRVALSDPKAAVKIAYNWHMGPFMPDDFSLTPWGSFAYSNVGADTIRPDDLDYICDQFTFLRFAHRTEVDPRPTIGSNSQGFEWKARCNLWTATAQGNAGEGSGIWIRTMVMNSTASIHGHGESAGSERLRRPTKHAVHVINPTGLMLSQKPRNIPIASLAPQRCSPA